METPRIVIPKRRFLAGKKAWTIVAIAAVLLLGAVIQIRMTWTRERTRGITADAVDFLHAVQTGVSSVIPPASAFPPISN